MNTPLRIYHYDIASGAYLKPEYFVKAMQLTADSGFTHFLPYLENMVRLPSMEKACAACAYTPEHWRQFDSAARDAGIELVPHFNVIGHSGHVCAKYPELAGVPGEGELDVTLDVTKVWTVGCLEQFCEFSEGKYFLIGGDEWQAPRHLLDNPDFDVARAWADQINLACQTLIAKGRSPIVWHDMLMHYPEALDLISQDAVIAFWFYDEDSDYPFLEMLKTHGFRTIMASGIGTCTGLVAQRQKRAIACAKSAMERYAVDGFMMTLWGDDRWEKQTLTIPVTGALLRGNPVPEIVLNTSSVLETLGKLPKESRFAKRCWDQLTVSLTDKVWTSYPEFHEYLTSMVEGDPVQEQASFLRYHYDAGPLLERIKAKQRVQSAVHPVERSSEEKETRDNDIVRRLTSQTEAFQLIVEEKTIEGPLLRFVNGNETFVIYPRFGGSLQDWRLGSVTIIPHGLLQFLSTGTGYPPGGFASYSGVGGLRPIWSLGAHSNPCILWQGPFDWKSVIKSDDTIAVELTRSLYHVDVRYTITVRKGLSGFVFRAEAVNHLDSAYGAFSFNLVLMTQAQDLDKVSFEWSQNGRNRRMQLSEQFESFFRIPAAEMTLVKPDYSVRIGGDPAKTAGFYVDWSTTYITPDLRGIYRKRSVDEQETVEWHFTPGTITTTEKEKTE